MIFVPSPQALLHGNHPNYTNLNLCNNVLGENSTKQEYLFLNGHFINCTFLTSPNSNDPNIISYFDAIIAIGHLLQKELNFDGYSFHLFFGLLSLQCNDISNAIYFLSNAAENGSIKAMNLLAKIYLFYQKFYGSESSIKISKNYLINAYHHSLGDTLFQLAELYSYSNNYALSLYFFYRHLRTINSNISVLNICYLLKYYLKDEKLTRKWILYSISLGEPKFIKDLIYDISNMLDNDHEKRNYMQINHFWQKVISKYYRRLSIPDQSGMFFQYFENEKLNTDLSSDAYTNSKFDFNSNPDSDLIAKPILDKINDIIPAPIEFQSSIGSNPKYCIQHSICDSNLNTTSKKNNFISYYPTKSKTKLVLDIFELVSSDFKKRNFKLAELYMSELLQHYSTNILNSEIFKLRSNSANHKWLTCCGFIYLLLGDIDSGLNMFLKAFKLGNFSATMMCGFILFHWKNDQEEMKKNACYFFLKCTSDPIALIHLSFILNDSSMLDRACSVLDTKSRIDCILWLINLLVKGIKMPSVSIYPAKVICIAGIEYGLKNDEDTADIYELYLRYFQ